MDHDSPAEQPPTAPDAAHFAVWADFVLAHTRIMRLIERALRADPGVTWSQYDLLYNLMSAPEQTMTVGEISASLLYSSGSTSNLITSMGKLGLVDRTTSQSDRRVIQTSITDAGRELFTRATSVVLRISKDEFTDFLGADEFVPVAAFMARLRTRDSHLRHPPYDLPIDLG
ncbi:MarR family winged helix-turn-helix transcriptional regulator [Glaciihabitans sp. dw_435]|uniref:MarR family winged helix-turn-helix transcriptional regulator n=1 Tax=Glaciihabitans sp. dw_435 TaxID=2720081 RepID=UPI001BD6C733|nr:MarR family winged helix-turn-helix transcriptional regulator [Glaciihabitans sp. dw_435]